MMALQQAVARLSPKCYTILQHAALRTGLERAAAGNSTSSSDNPSTSQYSDSAATSPSSQRSGPGFSRELLDLLVCPLTKAPLRYDMYAGAKMRGPHLPANPQHQARVAPPVVVVARAP